MIARRRAEARGHFDFGWLDQSSLRLTGIEPAEVLVFDLR
jgi:hypothetical protein